MRGHDGRLRKCLLMHARTEHVASLESIARINFFAPAPRLLPQVVGTCQSEGTVQYEVGMHMRRIRGGVMILLPTVLSGAVAAAEMLAIHRDNALDDCLARQLLSSQLLSRHY